MTDAQRSRRKRQLSRDAVGGALTFLIELGVVGGLLLLALLVSLVVLALV